MHKIEIPEEVRARAMLLRGREHIVETVVASRTAHVVVDLQNGFMAEGAVIEVPAAREIVNNVNLISSAIRDSGGINIFLRYTHDDAEPQPWTTRYSTYLAPDRGTAQKDAFRRGAEPWQLWPLLDVRPADLVVDKTRYSAFVPGTCALDDLLRARGIDTLIITGTATNVCCESTARDAMQRNYRVVFVADGTAAFTDAQHNATLCNMLTFADVMTTVEVVDVISASRMQGAA